MNYGLYLSAAAALSEQRRQEVITNNLVNAQTAGFKPDMVYGRQRLPERVATGAPVEPQLMLERLGGAPTLNPTYVSLQQGALVETGNDLDAALDGNGFFVVRGRDGQPRLTRDGRFALDADGSLVTQGTGFPVLDAGRQPIQLQGDQPVNIDAQGRIVQGGKVRAELFVTAPVDPRELVKVGDNLMRRADGELPRGAPEANVIQRHIESSAVDPVTTLKDLLSASRSLTVAVRMMQLSDNIMGQAINTLGRVA